MAAVVASQPFEVGQRVKDGVEFRGTVRYVGPVVTSKKDPAAIWVGVEWDDGTRGKHDGSVVDDATGERVRYFRCGATAGSFVKPSKVDGGVGLVAALRAKYVGMDAPVEAPGGHFEHKAYTKRGNTKAIEFCGELKVRAEQQLDEGRVGTAMLRCRGVRGLGDVGPGDFAQLATLVALDLQCNLLRRWADVAEIVDACPALRILDVSGNALSWDGAGDLVSLAKLESLAANGVGLRGWADVARLGEACGGLRVLHVANNDVCADGVGAAPFPRLELLDLAATGLADAAPLAALPRLAELHASENPKLAGLGTSVFAGLEALALSGCGVERWADVDALVASCPKLGKLRFGRDNAVTASLGASEARALLVARLPTVRHLNGADVSRKERVEAEKRYVRIATAQVAGGAPASDHPRLAALVEKHGDPNDAPKDAAGGAGGLAANLVQVTLRCVAAEACHLEPVTKKLPGSARVALVKRLAKKLFKLGDADVVLYFKPEADAWPVTLDDDAMTLAYFGVPDGATIDVADKLDEGKENAGDQ